MGAKKLTSAEVQELIDTLESKMKTANELANNHSDQANGYAHALGYLQGSLLYVISRLKGNY